MKLNSYQLFKERVNKLPLHAKKTILESIKSSKTCKVILKEYFQNSDKLLLSEASWKKEANDMNEKLQSKKSFKEAEKALTLSLANAGYSDKKAQLFVDYIMNGDYKEFLKGLRTYKKLGQSYDQGGKRSNTQHVRPGVGRPGAKNRAPGGVSPRVRGTGLDPNVDDFDYNWDDFNIDDKTHFDNDLSDTKKIKNQKLLKKPSAMSKVGNVAKGVKDKVSKATKGVKDKLGNVVKKAKSKLTPNWKKELQEAINNKDYNKLRILKEQLRKEIENCLLESISDTNSKKLS